MGEGEVYRDWWIGRGRAHYFRPSNGFLDRSDCEQVVKTALDAGWVHATDEGPHCMKCLEAEARDIELGDFAKECGFL